MSDSSTTLFNRARALVKMDEHGLDALVGATFANSYYMSGLRTLATEWCMAEPFSAAIFPRDPGKTPTLVTMTAFLPTLLQDHPTWFPQVRLYDWYSIDTTPAPQDEASRLYRDVSDFVRKRVAGNVENDLVTQTIAALNDLGLADKRVGFDDLRLASHVKAVLDGIEVVDAHDILMDIRKVRTPAELDLLKEAARINQEALERVIAEMRPGVRWSHLAYVYKDTFVRRGGRYYTDKGLLWGGVYKGEYVPDAFYLVNNDFALEEGNLYLIEGEGHFRGYGCDCNRTVFLGEPSKTYLKAVDGVMTAYQEIESCLRPGKPSSEVYKTVIRVMEEMGVPSPRKTLVATHGVGLEFVEWYTRFPTQKGVPDSYLIEENVTLGMDVLYYGHEIGTFHFENGLLIAKDGPRSFYAPPTTPRILPKGLIIKTGETVTTYCPNIRLAQEKGISPHPS